MELRATTILARLWQRQGKRAQAREALAATSAWFSEGVDTYNLRAAKSLLDALPQLGRAPSTIAREVRANCGRRHYRAWPAERRAERRLQRPKVAKLVRCPQLRHVVEHGLAQRWSPQQIARRLRIDYPDQAEMHVSHETI